MSLINLKTTITEILSGSLIDYTHNQYLYRIFISGSKETIDSKYLMECEQVVTYYH